MDEIITLLHRISIFGSINAFIIGIFLIVWKEFSKSKLFFGILLLLISITNIRNYLMHMQVLPKEWVMQTGFLHTTFWWPVLFYFFVFGKMGQDVYKQKIHYVLPILGLSFHFMISILGYHEHAFLKRIANIHSFLEGGSFLFYIIAWYKLLYKEKSTSSNIATKLIPVVTILSLYLISYPIVSILFVTAHDLLQPYWKQIFTFLSFYESFTIFLLALFGLTEIKALRVLFDNGQQKSPVQPIEVFLEQIESRKLYLNVDLTLENLAAELKTSSRVLSESINHFASLSFNKYINSLRIKTFQEYIKANRHKKFNIFGVAREAGFKSKATFNRVFKEFTGQTPSEYIKEIEKLD
ncbi:MAG: helix-turn-helix domain-containing protein [Bacteroidota bacterium]